jgi:alpha-L-fucosidase
VAAVAASACVGAQGARGGSYLGTVAGFVGCQVCVPDGDGGSGGYVYDLTSLPTSVFTLHDSYPVPYFITSPCVASLPNVETYCPTPPTVSSPAVQNPSTGLCLGLGLYNDTSVSLLSPSSPLEGFSLTLLEGDTYNCGYARQITYNFVCNASAPASQGPEPLVSTPEGCVYSLTWQHPAACGVYNASVQCPTAPLPLPTDSQAWYQEQEIAGLTHFNIETFVGDGDPACTPANWNTGVNSSNPNTFAPTNLNVSNWVESYKALGATHAILTAKHGCGFLLWPTNVTLPGGGEFTYGVMRQTVPSYGRNVVAEFLQTLRGANMTAGFYYSMGNSEFLCRINDQIVNTSLPGQQCVTDDEYNLIVQGHLAELWGPVSNGALTEIWMDHGVLQDAWVQATLTQLQPDAVVFNGEGVTANVVRWIGTESGEPSCPTGVWSTGDSYCGDPTSPVWEAACSDTTLQQYDHWFYVQGVPVRPLSDMITVYHDTVGQNSALELDFAIDPTGNVNATHAAMYAQFGDWIRACYGAPVAQASGNATLLYLALNGTTPVDRVVLQENIRLGQRVRAYSVDVLRRSSGQWQNLGSGTSIGHKTIVLSPSVIPDGIEVRLNITSAVAQPIISNFGVFSPCPSS